MKQKTLNVIVGIIAFILISVIVIGIGSSWFTNKNFSTWFNSWGKGETEGGKEDGDKNDNGELAEGDRVELLVLPIAVSDYPVYGISATALSAYSIKATVKDESGSARDELQSVKFSIAWAPNSDIDPALYPVSNYVVMDVKDAVTATFTCNKPFTASIDVTAVSTIDETKSATATIDYYKRVTGGTVKFMNGTSERIQTGSTRVVDALFPYSYNDVLQPAGDWGNWGNAYGGFEVNLWWLEELTFSDGTVENKINWSAATVTITPSEEFKAEYNSGRVTCLMKDSISFKYTDIAAQRADACGCLNAFYYKLCVGSGNDPSILTGQRVYDSLCKALNSTSMQFTVTISDILPQYGEPVTLSYVLNVNINNPGVGSVDVDNSSILFRR